MLANFCWQALYNYCSHVLSRSRFCIRDCSDFCRDAVARTGNYPIKDWWHSLPVAKWWIANVTVLDAVEIRSNNYQSLHELNPGVNRAPGPRIDIYVKG